jgi:prepilin-type processing-associated H-X9-DG protein
MNAMPNGSKDRTTRPGFNIVELLVVIGLIGMLIGLLLPAVQKVRDSASRASCQNNLKQVGLALHHFHDSQGRLPPQKARRDANTSHDPDTLLSWMALILPQLEQEALWKVSEQACRSDRVTFHNPPHVGYATVVRAYVCPTDGRLSGPLQTPSGDRAAFTSYIGIAGIPGLIDGQTLVKYPLLGPLGGSPGLRLTDITDGTSQTLMAGERPPPDSLQAGRWYSTVYRIEPFGGPNSVMWFPPMPDNDDVQCLSGGAPLGPGRLDNPCDRFHLWSLHTGGANGLFADGSVRFLNYSAAPTIMALSTSAGGEVVEIP